jgi:tRNA A-37 threonylcarbamoyl transferase component Bud32
MGGTYGSMALVSARPGALATGKKHPVFCQCAQCQDAEAQQAAVASALGVQNGYSDEEPEPARSTRAVNSRRKYSDDDVSSGSGYDRYDNSLQPRQHQQRMQRSRNPYNDDPESNENGSYQSVDYSVDGDQGGDGEEPVYAMPPPAAMDTTVFAPKPRGRADSAPIVRTPARQAVRPEFVINFKRLRTAEKIGEGAFGIVYSGKYQDEPVAIKRMHAHLCKQPTAMAEFCSEVNLMCELKHPNLLKCVAASTTPPNIMLVTEFMKRGTLFDVINRDRIRLTWALIRKIALQVAKGMAYLHEHGILHRDLKSSNLMVDYNYCCKVGDFGLAKAEFSPENGSGLLNGTYQYLAPECLRGETQSAKSDVFAYGLVVWEMVSGTPPYLGVEPLEAARRVLEEGVRPPIPSHCLRQYAAIIQACWADAPAARPSFEKIINLFETTTK